MEYVSYNGVSKGYEVCTENYEKALKTNGQIDGVAGTISEYETALDDILANATGALDSSKNLFGGINSSISQLKAILGLWKGSYPAMQEENLEEAKKIDDAETENNKNAALEEAKAEYNRNQESKKSESSESNEESEQ